jgi:predicted DCC family thiol-disulfide oxidoreductase YuxK
MLKDNKRYKIILFDGVCNLCNSSVTLVIKRDKKNIFKFAALQSEIGKHYEKSTAALKIARHLSGGYPLLYGFMIVPNFIRNWVYDYIAKNRYKWYGKRESCMIPTPELKEKFL